MIKVASSQFASSKNNFDGNMNKALEIAKKASDENVNILLFQELFQSEYFCSTKNDDFFELAIEFPTHNIFQIFSNFCKSNNMVMPISFFEKYQGKYFNSLVVIDADGSLSDIYRKSHIPEGPGYNEKFYFSPGDTGFKVFNTKFATIGCAICWDQWFPECARILTMQGAEILFYPTAIGSEPQDPDLDSRKHWRNVMIGHAAANQIPIVASNRVGIENEKDITIKFYGNSLIIDHVGDVVSQMNEEEEGLKSHDFNIEEIRNYRQSWGNFRDRRPDLYKKICDF
ncbi:N-carbamoylputrescine amidase [bacterium]|jgi:N-carbamoylputrescine amidase|nr:N-carbamoylputrescine amidase [bacterium]|tara:strand:- start:5902 stop:6756 length:855 start_codon:yes stop_codon:yes gene_type:complete